MNKTRNINTEIDDLLKEYNLSKDLDDKCGMNEAFKGIMELTKPIVLYAINQMSYREPITKQDLEEVCYITLWEIVDKYKACKYIPFTVYVVRYLKYAMINYIRDEQNIIKIPHNVSETNAKIRRAKTNRETLKYFTEKQLEDYEMTKNYIDYRPLDDEYDLEDETANNIINIDCWNNERLQEVYEGLNEDEKALLNAIVLEEMSYAEYGRLVGKTREAIRVRYNKLIKKIKERMKQNEEY